MKFLWAIALCSLTSSAFADFAAYSKLSQFKVVNEAGKAVYTTDVSNFKRADLRDDVAGILSAYNTLTVVDKEGKSIVQDAFASDYKITSKYIATLGGKQLKVFNRQGSAFINKSWVAAVGISNSMIAYREDRAGNMLVVLNEQGEEIFTAWNNVEAKVSDSFVFAKDQYGYVSLYDKSGRRLEYSNNYTDYQLSDSYAATTDSWGFTQVYNKNGDVFLSGYNMKITHLLNDLIAYEQSGQTFVVNSKKENIFWASNASAGYVTVLDSGLVYKDNAGFVRFQSANGISSYSTSRPVAYFLTNNLLGYQSSAQNLSIFNYQNLNIYNAYSADLALAGVSSNLFAIKTKTANGFQLFNAQGTKVVDEISVQDFYLSTTSPALNWQKF